MCNTPQHFPEINKNLYKYVSLFHNASIPGGGAGGKGKGRGFDTQGCPCGVDFNTALPFVGADF